MPDNPTAFGGEKVPPTWQIRPPGAGRLSPPLSAVGRGASARPSARAHGRGERRLAPLRPQAVKVTNGLRRAQSGELKRERVKGFEPQIFSMARRRDSRYATPASSRRGRDHTPAPFIVNGQIKGINPRVAAPGVAVALHRNFQAIEAAWRCASGAIKVPP